MRIVSRFPACVSACFMAGTLLLPGLSAADVAAPIPSPTPTDFAWGIPLTLQADTPLQRAAVPAAVYAGVVNADLGDLRIFNAAGEAVPHTLLAPPAAAVTVEWAPAPMFPLPASTSAKDLAVQVRTDASGAVVQVEHRAKNNPPSDSAKESQRAWLVDLSQLDRSGQTAPVTQLRLQWTPPAAPFVGQLEVSGSDTLDRWQPLTTATIAELSHGVHRLRRDEIALPRTPRYLRLSWPRDLPPLELTGIEAGRGSAAQQPWQWREVAANRVDAEAVLFDAGGLWPVSQLQLALAGANQLVAADIASAASPDGPWQSHARHRFHRLRIDATELRNKPLALPPRAARYWRLRGDPALLGSATLQLGWQPHQLIFLNQGEGLYTLAYGSGRVASSANALPELLRTQTDSAALTSEVVVGEPAELGGLIALQPDTTLPWRRIGLWAVLIAGVILLGGMAWRLVQELGSTPAGRD